MTSATEKLRRLLDERGAHWWEGEDERKTLWESNGLTWEYFNDDNGDAWLGFLGVCESDVSPEQAIAATLGNSKSSADAIAELRKVVREAFSGESVSVLVEGHAIMRAIDAVEAATLGSEREKALEELAQDVWTEYSAKAESSFHPAWEVDSELARRMASFGFEAIDNK